MIKLQTFIKLKNYTHPVIGSMNLQISATSKEHLGVKEGKKEEDRLEPQSDTLDQIGNNFTAY